MFLRFALLTASAVLLTPGFQQANAARKPNILLIISEDNGPHFGCYGDRTVDYTSQVLVETGPTQTEIDSSSESIQAMYATWRNSPQVELYDLENDPHERVNLADKPELRLVRERLLGQLIQWREQTNDPFLDPAKIDMLAEEHRQQDAVVRAQGRGAYRPWRYPEYLYGQQ